jgi:hypothetical protein
MNTYTHYDGLTGRDTVTLTMDQAESCSHPGPCDDDVAALLDDVEIKPTPSELRAMLGEYGAWDDDQLSDDDDNRARMLWIAACDIAENPGDYMDDAPA